MRFGAFSVVQAAIQRRVGGHIAKFLAILAVVLQVLLPGTLALAEANGVDVSRFICGSSGQMSAETKVAVERLAKLLGHDAPDPQPLDGPCTYCTLVQAVPLPEPVTSAAPTDFAAGTAYVRCEAVAFVRKTAGTPCGSRGPPSHA